MELETVIKAVDYFGVIVFAISGSLVAARRQMDIVGFAMLATVTGIGGGTLRDLLLDLPVFWLSEPWYLIVCVFTSLATFVCARSPSPPKLMAYLDALGLGAFAVIGTRTTLSGGSNTVIAIIMGMMTASFGGLIRDMLSREIPLILRKEVYASAALAGASIYVILQQFQLPPVILMLVSFLTTVTIRGIAIRYSLGLPRFNQKSNRKIEAEITTDTAVSTEIPFNNAVQEKELVNP